MPSSTLEEGMPRELVAEYNAKLAEEKLLEKEIAGAIKKTGKARSELQELRQKLRACNPQLAALIDEKKAGLKAMERGIEDLGDRVARSRLYRQETLGPQMKAAQAKWRQIHRSTTDNERLDPAERQKRLREITSASITPSLHRLSMTTRS